MFLCGKIEGADAEAIAGQDYAMAFAVPQGDGELPLEVLEHSFLILFPQMRDELGIAMGAELMSLGLEPGLHFGIVKEFTIEDGDDRTIFVKDRLFAVEKTDD